MKTILIQPGIKQSFGFRSPPLSLLPLAGTLKDANQEVEIFDARRHDYHKLDLKDTICVGLTVLTGSQIIHALRISEYVKKKNPKIKVVWGGVHPSMLPEQTIKNKFIDVVVKGEGELTLLEIVETLKKGKSLKKIKGIVYKEKEKTIENPDRPFMNFNKSALHPYELLKDKKTYDTDIIHIQTSRGCPYNCGFCYNKNFNKNSYRYKTPNKVIKEIERAIKLFGTKQIHFDEDNFFVKQERVREICEKLVEKKLNIVWSSTCRLDYFARYDPEFLKLLKKSGCKSLAFGGESGSQKILNYIKKGITVKQTIKAVENAKKCGIKPILSFVCGFPGETKEDVELTMDLIAKLKKINKNFETNGIFIFTPYPETPIFLDAIKMGLKEPKSLEEWGHCYFGDSTQTPWFTEKHRKYLISVSKVGELLFAKPNPNFTPTFNYFLKYIGRVILYTSANLRFKLRFFKFPIELILYDKYTTKLK